MAWRSLGGREDHRGGIGRSLGQPGTVPASIMPGRGSPREPAPTQPEAGQSEPQPAYHAPSSRRTVSPNWFRG